MNINLKKRFKQVQYHKLYSKGINLRKIIAYKLLVQTLYLLAPNLEWRDWEIQIKPNQ